MNLISLLTSKPVDEVEPEKCAEVDETGKVCLKVAEPKVESSAASTCAATSMLAALTAGLLR